MKNVSLITPTNKMLVAAVSLACASAYAGSTEGYLSTSTAAGRSEVGPTAVYTGQDSVIAREAARRRAEEQAAMQLLQEGHTAYNARKYSEALEKFRQAWSRLPHAPATRKAQEYIRSCINDASVAVAMEYSKVGRYDDAEQLLLDVLSRDPKNAYATKQLSYLRDPERNNPALSPEHVRDVDEVNRLLRLAWGYYQLGKFDQAFTEFANVLKIDPYNTAARRGQEAVNQRRSHYYTAAHDAYRSHALAEVDALWQEVEPVDVDVVQASQEVAATPGNTAQMEKTIEIRNALSKIVVDTDGFDDGTPISDVLPFIIDQLKKAQAADGSPLNINVNFKPRAVTNSPVAAPAAASSSDDDDDEDDEDDGDATPAPAPVAAASTSRREPTVYLSRRTGVPLDRLIREICDAATPVCDFDVNDIGVRIFEKGDPDAVRLETRTWNNVPWSYIAGESGDDDDDDDDGGDVFADSSASKGGKHKKDPKAALGGSWPKGSSAQYRNGTQTLTVTNTPDFLDDVDAMISEARNQETHMVRLTTKFVEVSQTNEDELSFDWVVNPFSVSNSGNLYAGGVNGSASNPSRVYDNFVTNGGSAYTNYHRNNGTWPVVNNSPVGQGSDIIGNGLMTGGLRSGTGAISTSPMDSLLKVGTPRESSAEGSAPSPGILSLSGIYDEGSFQMIMRGLSQKKGVDVMTAPSLVLTPGDDLEMEIPEDPNYQMKVFDRNGGASIEVVRRFVFPVEYEPPQIERSGSSWSLPIAAPAHPSVWGAEEVGVTMILKADQLDPGKDIVKFNTFLVQIVEFEGFINYGCPIYNAMMVDNSQTGVHEVVLTENRIDQPIFSRKTVNTRLSLNDGYTVAIGGLIEDKVQKVEDKVPVFGDLPFIGRFFRSNAESHIRKNLTIFVTADIIDATGRTRRSRRVSEGQQGADAALTPGLFPEDPLAN